MSQRTNPATPSTAGERWRYGPDGFIHNRAGQRSFLDDMAAASAGSPSASPANLSDGQLERHASPGLTSVNPDGASQELQQLVNITEGGR